MGAVAVVTDSTQYLPAEVLERHGIAVVSLYVTMEGSTRKESELTDLDAFYDRLRSATALPSTSQPSVGDFLSVYEPLLDAGRDVVSIHLSGGISGTVGSAEQAREQLVERGTDPARVVVVDSTTAAAGHGLMAVAAANAAEAGAGAAGAAERARELRAQLRILFAVDTLEYLRRGGRIGGAQAWIGSTLKIKPILTIESEIVAVERVRTAGRAFERLVHHLQSLHGEGADRFFIQHVQAPDTAQRLAGRGAELFGHGPDVVTELGPVFGAHVGPGIVGVTALRSDVLGPV